MPFVADPRLHPVAPERLARWVDRPLTRHFPRLERGVIAVGVRLSGGGRPLLESEGAILRPIFGPSLDLDPVRVVETSWLNAPTVLGHNIRIRRGYIFDGRRAAVLVHEAVHLWQFQHFGTGYISDSVFHNLRSMLRTGHRALAYMNYQLQPGSRMADFTAEQQATIVADWFELTQLARATVVPSWAMMRRGDLPIYEQLVAEVRATRKGPL